MIIARRDARGGPQHLHQRPVRDAFAVRQAAAPKYQRPSLQHRGPFAKQPGLADAGRADHDERASNSLFTDTLPKLDKQTKLRATPHERSASQRSRLRDQRGFEYLPGANRCPLALGRDQLHLPIHDRLTGRPVRLRTDVDRTGWRVAHQPRSGVRSVPHSGVVLASLRTNQSGHGLAGVDADVQVEPMWAELLRTNPLAHS